MLKFGIWAGEVENGSVLVIESAVETGGNVVCYNEDKTIDLGCLITNNNIQVIIDHIKQVNSSGNI